MSPPLIERQGRVECIACHAWVLPNERLRANFVGGHNVRFHVCLDCLQRHKTPKRCKGCGVPLTANNAAFERRGGKVRLNRSRCLVCWTEYYNKRKLQRRLAIATASK